MRNQFILWIVLLAAAGCETKSSRYAAPVATEGAKPKSPSGIESNGIQYAIVDIKQCRYPANDPLFEKKWNKKLLLFRMKLTCTDMKNKADVMPEGGLLTDSRGNSYTTSPGVIAMAQSNGCIKGDDIKAYNAIWNAELKKGEMQTAYVLGFELPEDAIPVKMYWNNDWKNQNLFFLFPDTNYVINH